MATHRRRTSPLLAGAPLFRARTPDELERSLRAKYNIRSVQAARGNGRFLGLANRVLLEGVGLQYCRYDTPTEIGFSEMPGYRQFFCISGAAELSAAGRTIIVDPSITGILPPASAFDAAYGQKFQQLVVQFDVALLQRKAELLTGRSRSLEDVPVMTPLAISAAARTRSIAFCLAEQFAAPLKGGSLAVAELTDALALCFLEERLAGLAPSNDVPSVIADRPAAVRLQDYIHANWDQALSVEAVASAAGMSVRSVFGAFKQAFGVPPAVYIRDLRLDHAQRLLVDPGASASVTDVALSCGFASFGHFARRYRERFGELPSDTLARRPPN